LRQEKETAQNQDPQKKEDASSSSPPEEEGLGLILKVKHGLLWPLCRENTFWGWGVFCSPPAFLPPAVYPLIKIPLWP